jgi:membrane-bound inhibitor of C-type lysozyme
MIEIDRMHFGLVTESTAGPGQRYGCSVLTLWRDGDKARVEMEGAAVYENCRAAATPPSNGGIRAVLR